MYKDVVILIPAYNPNIDIMKEFICTLNNTFPNIVIVNDGSLPQYTSFFNQLSTEHIVITHYINLGKGRALKTGINYILNNYPNIKAIITADSDGQHAVKDIKKCYHKWQKSPDSLILGCRDFKSKEVPFKSRYGNKITKDIFMLFTGLKISDTQTGLRVMSKEVATYLLNVKGERYEYETNVLLATKRLDISITEEKIGTIYLNNNKESHFNPIKDSIEIYKLFMKYIISSLSSFILDIFLFIIFIKLTNEVITSSVISRIISSIYNFLINKNLIFKNSDNKSIIKYYLLVIIQLAISTTITQVLNNCIKLNIVIIKILVDTFIFIINFVIQREIVFKKNK